MIIPKELKTRKATRIEKDLLRAINALELMQCENYSSITSITLSYLYDIRDGKVPKKMITKPKIMKRLKVKWLKKI